MSFFSLCIISSWFFLRPTFQLSYSNCLNWQCGTVIFHFLARGIGFVFHWDKDRYVKDQLHRSVLRHFHGRMAPVFPPLPAIFPQQQKEQQVPIEIFPHRWWHLHIAILSVAPRSLLLYPFRSVPDLRMTMLSGGPPPRYPSPSLPPFPPPPPPPPVVVDPHQSRVDFMCSFQFFTLHFPLLLLFCWPAGKLRQGL